MAAYTHSAFATTLFHIVYDTAEMRSIVAENTKLLEMFQEWDEPPSMDASGGQYWEFGVLSKWPSSAGAMAFNGTTRTPQISTVTTGKVYQRQQHATIQLEYAGMKMSQTKPQAYKKLLELAKDGIMLRIRDHRVKQYLGGNAGTLATCNGAAGPTQTIAVHGMLGYKLGNGNYITEGAEVFKVGDQILIDPAASAQYRLVDATDPTAGTIHVTVNVTYTDGMTICYGESGTNSDYLTSMDGLADLYNSGVAYETIDPATVALWNPQVYNGAVAGAVEPLATKHINRLLIGPEINAGGKTRTVLSNIAMLQAFLDLFADQIRYEPGDTLEGGMPGVTWDMGGRKCKFFFDTQAPHHTLLGIPEEDGIRFTLDAGGWMDQDGSELKWVPNTTQYAAVWASLQNFGCRFRNRWSIQRDIEEALF